MKKQLCLLVFFFLSACSVLPVDSDHSTPTQADNTHNEVEAGQTRTHTEQPSTSVDPAPTKPEKTQSSSPPTTQTPELTQDIDYVIISPWDEEVTVYRDQQAKLRFGVVTCDHDLTEIWVQSLEVEVILQYDGQIKQSILHPKSSDYWNDLYIRDQNLELCHGAPPHTWGSEWRSEILLLTEEGDYQLHTNIVLIEPLTDGFDLDSDGEPDWYDAGIRLDSVVMIHFIVEDLMK